MISFHFYFYGALCHRCVLAIVRRERLLLGPPLRLYVEYTNYVPVRPAESQQHESSVCATSAQGVSVNVELPVGMWIKFC